MAVKLHRTIAQKKHDEASEPWASIGNIKADTDKQWLTSALALLGKHRGWIASASIRELLQYLVENKISTDRALREHLGMPVPQRTFDANAALISKQFQGISPEEASSRADKLISQIPALADYVITDIDRFVDGDKGILSRASADLRPTIRKALKRGLATLDGGEVETNMTWETSFRKVHDFLVYAEPESNYQMLEALYDLLGLGDPEHVWSLMKRGVETALGAMTEQDRQREAASFCARLTTLSMATDSAPSGSVDPKAQPPQ